LGIILKHFFRIFTILLVITFSISARESYGQTVVNFTITKSTICPGEVTKLRVSANGPITFYWQYYNGTEWVDWVAFLQTITNSSAVEAQPNLQYTYRYRIRYNLGSTPGAGQEYYSNELILTVLDASNTGFISPMTQDVCIGGVATPIALSGSVGNIIWQKSSTTNDADFVTIPSETNTSLSNLSTTSVGTLYYRAIATNGSSCPSNTSEIVSVNVIPASNAGTATLSGTSTICANTTAPELTLSGYTGTIESWLASATITGTYTAISGTTTPTISNTNSAYYKASV
jgi:hypothetical protein